MRIIKDAGLHPRRTIRVALWGGEEQGLLGSKAWVQQHLTGDANGDERRKLDVYFNIDNGTGPIYGWYAQSDDGARRIFDRWLEPLKEYGAWRNTSEPIGSTDHLSFIAAGVPGFNPIQDYTNYDVRTHHTNMDTADRLECERHSPGRSGDGGLRLQRVCHGRRVSPAEYKIASTRERRSQGADACLREQPTLQAPDSCQQR